MVSFYNIKEEYCICRKIPYLIVIETIANVFIFER